jgi:heptosyltransferase-3
MPPERRSKPRGLANLRAQSLGTNRRTGNKVVKSVRCKVSNRAISYPLGLKILLLRGGALGDLLLTLPVLDAIRSEFPHAYIELWGIHPQAGLLQSIDRVDRLDRLDVAPLFVSNPIAPVLRRRLKGFDLAVSFLSDPDGVVAENLASAGVQSVIKCSPIVRPGVHAVRQLAAVLDPIGVELRDPVPRLKIDRKPDQGSLLGFHPGSGSQAKNWPVERWSEFVEAIAPKFEKLVLIGGEADDEVIRAFRLRCRGAAFDTMIRPNLWDLARVLSTCTIFVGHDTGVTHLSAAVQTPTVALFGPTDPEVWRPLGDHVEIIQGEGGRIDAISVATVLKAVNAHC